jgi:hypothetical protein
MYRDDNDDEMSPWLSTLYSAYIPSGNNTDTNHVFFCKSDENEREGNGIGAWCPRKDKAFTEAYDRSGSTPSGADGYTILRNPEVERISYFYECSHAGPPSWPGGSSYVSWSAFKKWQLKEGWDDDGNSSTPGKPYDPTIFPVVRCFWHIERGSTLPWGNGTPFSNNVKPVLNITYGGNRCYSTAYWESGILE